MKTELAALALVLSLVAPAGAQDKDVPATPPKGAQMTPEGQKFIAGWLGQWTSNDATLSIGEERLRGTIETSCGSVASGWGALCTRKASLAGLPPWTTTLLIGWNMATGQGHVFEVSDAADVNDLAGTWATDASMSIARDGKNLEGQQERIACRLSWPSADAMKVDCTASVAGSTTWTFAYTSTRRK